MHGGIRICGDFKVSINPVLQSHTYPLPTPEEMFSALANGESYTKLDLARAYKQMKVREECQSLLTINTHRGLYRYTRLPFGITTAPSLWQQAMAQVLSGIPNVGYYIDDILIGCSVQFNKILAKHSLVKNSWSLSYCVSFKFILAPVNKVSMATNNRLLSFYTLSLKLKLVYHLLFSGHEIFFPSFFSNFTTKEDFLISDNYFRC